MSEQPSSRSGQPPSNPYQAYPGPGSPWVPDHPDAALVLVLGIVGLTACQVVAPFAWVKGTRVRREIAAAQGMLGGSSQANIGFALGIAGTCLLGLYALGLVAYLLFVVFFVAAGAS